MIWLSRRGGSTGLSFGLGVGGGGINLRFGNIFAFVGGCQAPRRGGVSPASRAARVVRGVEKIGEAYDDCGGCVRSSLVRHGTDQRVVLRQDDVPPVIALHVFPPVSAHGGSK